MSHPSHPPQNSRIMVVDDDEVFARTLATAFERRGYRVLQATSGSDALALLSLELSRQPGSIASIWYPNAVAAAFLVAAPGSRWPALLLTLALVNPLANGLWGDGLLASLAFVPANLAEVALAAWLLRRQGLASTAQLSAAQVMRWLLLGGVLPQLVGATLGALTLSWHGGSGLATLWLKWFEGTVVGSLSLLPLALTVADRGWRASLLSLRDGRLLALVPELPEEQKEALSYGVKVPLLYTNVFLRDGFTCQYCGSPHHLTFDHVVPRRLGGKSEGEEHGREPAGRETGALQEGAAVHLRPSRGRCRGR